MSTFIELTLGNDHKLFNINNIALITELKHGCSIFVSGDAGPFHVEESYRDIKQMIRKENVIELQ